MQNTLIWIVAAVIILGGGYWLWQSQTPATDTGTNVGIVDTGAGSQVPVETGPVNTGMTATVKYNGSTFSPAEVTIKVGGTVTFESEGGSSMWVASGPHPEHTGYSGTTRSAHCPDTSNASFDQCVAGDSYTFAFKKIGTWPYHNHMNAGVFGKVTVVE
ncbi:MAG: hypothetical protein Q7S50_00180 [bacterium]|nr:hypothetical protein [bacterium]